MRTESEEREVVEGGEPVLPTPEEARKPDPCTEVGLVATFYSIFAIAILTLMRLANQTLLCQLGLKWSSTGGERADG